MGKFVIRTAPSGYKFNLKAANGQVIAVSEVYLTLASCKKGIESIRKNAPKAKFEDRTEEYTPATNPRFEMFQDKAGQYRFRLRSRNGQIIAASEGYTTKASCLNGIDSVRKNAPTAEELEE